MSSHGRGLDEWADRLGTYTDDEAIAAMQILIRRLDVAESEVMYVLGWIPEDLPNADAIVMHFGHQAHRGIGYIRDELSRALRGFRTHERGNS